MNTRDILLGLSVLGEAEMKKMARSKGKLVSLPNTALCHLGINKGIKKICKANNLKITGTKLGITISV